MERLLVRSAVLVSYARVATAMGLDAQAVASEVCIRPEPLASPDLTVQARRAYRLMELAALREASSLAPFRAPAMAKAAHRGKQQQPATAVRAAPSR